jgi:hypothetical protein
MTLGDSTAKRNPLLTRTVPQRSDIIGAWVLVSMASSNPPFNSAFKGVKVRNISNVANGSNVALGSGFNAPALDHRLTVRLDADHFGDLDQMAKREGFSVSVIVRHLVYRYIEQQRRFAAKG